MTKLNNESLVKNETQLFENLGEKWLPSSVAASILGVSSNALRIKVYRGQVRAYKLGSQLRFKYSDLRALLQKKECS